jgi:DNA-binding transcriptional MerR regulator/methylmalonyl-CoA mutase cobalamin-binding subunit
VATDDDIPRHRIGAVSRLTGISTHALRVWERRYGADKPQRSDGGDRLYSDADVQRLRTVKRLLGLGHAIGDLARLSVNDLAKLESLHASTVGSGGVPSSQLVERYLEHLSHMDLAAAEQTLAGAALAFPRREVIDRVFVPLLHEIGTRWQSGALHVAEEHAASAMVQRHLGAMLRLFAPEPAAPTAIATTPSNELHELGAAMAAVVAAMNGWRSIYLGPNLPVDEIVHAAVAAGASAVLLSCVAVDVDALVDFVADLDVTLPGRARIVLGGAAVQSMTRVPSRVVAVSSMAELDEWLALRRTSPRARVH